MKRIGKALIGMYLLILSAVMLYTASRAIPDGVTIYVNQGFIGEAHLDLIALSIGVIIGLSFVFYQFAKLWKQE